MDVKIKPQSLNLSIETNTSNKINHDDIIKLQL